MFILSALSAILNGYILAAQASNNIQQAVLEVNEHGLHIPPGDYAPWTSPPICAQIIEDSTASGDLFCMYSKRDFDNGRGLIAFTTPSNAKAMAENNVLRTGHHIKNSETSSMPPFEMREIPGKGFGLFANRTIYRGERLIQEPPMIIYHNEIGSFVDNKKRILLHQEGMSRLSIDSREEFLKLYKNPKRLALDDVDNILQTNAFGALFGEHTDTHMNLHPLASRINHECRGK